MRRLLDDSKAEVEDVKEEGIAVLSMYRAQCVELNKQLQLEGLKGVHVSTVVAAQG